MQKNRYLRAGLLFLTLAITSTGLCAVRRNPDLQVVGVGVVIAENPLRSIRAQLSELGLKIDMHSICSGDFAHAREMLLRGGFDINQVFNDKRQTGLMLAVIHSKGRTDIVRLFMSCGADLNRVDVDNKTALTHAIEHGNVDVVRLLLEAGAIRYFEGCEAASAFAAVTALDKSCFARQPIFEMLIKCAQADEDGRPRVLPPTDAQLEKIAKEDVTNAFRGV